MSTDGGIRPHSVVDIDKGAASFSSYPSHDHALPHQMAEAAFLGTFENSDDGVCRQRRDERQNDLSIARAAKTQSISYTWPLIV